MRFSTPAALALLFALPLFTLSCADTVGLPPRPVQPEDQREERQVQETIAFTQTPYAPAEDSAITPISDLLGVIAQLNDQFTQDARDEMSFPPSVWAAFAPGKAFPITGDCEPERSGTQRVATVDELPLTIEGVVTLHPRYFVKSGICGSDQRFYGSFTLEDASGGIMVLRDSRISEFTFGDRVRITVGAVARQFDYNAVLAIDKLEVLTPLPKDRAPIYFQPRETAFSASDIGRVVRIRGVVSQQPTNNNFNEMRLASPDGRIEWIVALDREFGQRNPVFPEGQLIELTGPVTSAFGVKMLISSYGQINVLPPQ